MLYKTTMQGSSNVGKPKSTIAKKKGGFLFASIPEKTEEDLRKEREQTGQQQQVAAVQESIVAHSSSEAGNPPADSHLSSSTHSRLISSLDAWESSSPQRVPGRDMATASSLRERLRQYQSLKAEQLSQPSSVSGQQAPVAPAPDGADDDANSFLGPPTTASAIAAQETQDTKEGGALASNDSEPPGTRKTFDMSLTGITARLVCGAR